LPIELGKPEKSITKIKSPFYSCYELIEKSTVIDLYKTNNTFTCILVDARCVILEIQKGKGPYS
jgi:hypothetical protein